MGWKTNRNAYKFFVPLAGWVVTSTLVGYC
jgi:hypothetical protein